MKCSLTVVALTLSAGVAHADVLTGEVHKITPPPPPVILPLKAPDPTPPAPEPPKPISPKPTPKPVVSKSAASSAKSAPRRVPAPLPVVEIPQRQSFGEAIRDPENYRREKFLYHTPLIAPNAVADPLHVSLAPSVSGSNLLIALLFVFLVWIANFAWDSIFHDYGSVIGAFFSRFLPSRRVSEEGLRRTVLLLILLALYGIIGAYGSADFSIFNTRNIGLLAIAVLTFIIATYANDVPRLVTARTWGCDARLTPNVSGVLLAIGCTALSRFLNVAPGFLYGLPMSFMLLTALPEGRSAGALEFRGIVWMIVAALVTWALLPLVVSYEVVHDFLNALYVVLLESAFWLLLPLGALPGKSIFDWRRGVWIAVFVATVFLLFHTLFNPMSSVSGLLSNPPALHTIGLMAAFAALSVLIWYVLRLSVPEKTSTAVP